MTGKGKGNNSDHTGSSRPTSGRLSLRTEENNKKQRVLPLMDLSTSAAESKTNNDDTGKTLSTDENDTTINNLNTTNEVQEIREVVKNLTTVMVKYIPNYSTTMTPSGLPLLISNEIRPTKCLVPNGKETENIISMLHRSSNSPSKSKQVMKSVKSRALQQVNKYGKYKGRKSGSTIPRWMPVDFKPPNCMLINEVEAKIAAYIFSSDEVNSYPGNEILVKYGCFMVDREKLRTLMPTKHLHQDVINMLVCRLTHTKQLVGPDPTCWYLPTMFVKYALDKDNETSPETLSEMYQAHFMGKVELLRKIFIPIHDESIHWYLLVVDIDDKKLILLDSNKCAFRSEWRRLQVRKLAVILQEMFIDGSFYAFSHPEKPEIGGFQLIEPNGIGQQLPRSNDSGVWVANWMLDHDWDDDYDKLTIRTSRIITTASRMRIALDLVLHGYNDLRDLVIKKATKNWTACANHRDKIMHSFFH